MHVGVRKEEENGERGMGCGWTYIYTYIYTYMHTFVYSFWEIERTNERTENKKQNFLSFWENSVMMRMIAACNKGKEGFSELHPFYLDACMTVTYHVCSIVRFVQIHYTHKHYAILPAKGWYKVSCLPTLSFWPKHTKFCLVFSIDQRSSSNHNLRQKDIHLRPQPWLHARHAIDHLILDLEPLRKTLRPVSVYIYM